MNTVMFPGFTAERSLSKAKKQYRYRRPNESSSTRGKISPAFRVTCPGNPFLGLECTILGGGAAWPCWWNSTCMWIQAGLAYPPCFWCSYS